MKITFTPAAETFMRRMVRLNSGLATAGFRLTVTAGGCAGLVSAFSIEAAPLPDDVILDVNGLKVFLPPSSSALLDGATVDFSDGALASGLTFAHPNMGDCGCGSSTPGRGGRHATVSIAAIHRKS